MAEDVRIARKLTTILSADIAGYSGFMESDEAGTLADLRRMRDRIIALIERHHGRVVNTAGDGLLAEFTSVVEAVLCAVEAQRELATCPGRAEPRMRYRIGINLGDVLVENGDLFGEGVNVAARLQGLAEPGGVLIAGTVHDVVRGKLDIAYDYLGPQQVKNIAAAVPAYRINLHGSDRATHTPPAAAPAPGSGPSAAPGSAPRSAARSAEGAAQGLAAPAAGPVLAMAIAAGTLLVLSFLPSLEWTAWPGLAWAYGIGAHALARRLRGRARIAAQFALLPVFLLGINLLSDGQSWWFIYPTVILTTLAVAIDPGGPARLAAWLRRL